MNLQRRTKSVTFGHCAGLSPVACAEPSQSKGEPKGVRHTPDSYRDRKEKDTETGYSYPSTGSGRRFGARYLDTDLSIWLSVDPMADKYPSMSAYMYTAGNPVMLVDPDGLAPRIYIETKGFGHAFVTVGEGENTIVYTYGRYGALTKDKESGRSTTPTGEGVLVRLTGAEAKSFIQDQMLENDAVAYEFTNLSEEQVKQHFENIFNSSNIKPSEGEFKNSENARVIDEYNLFSNNCVTTSVEGMQSGIKEDLHIDSQSPQALKVELNEKNYIKIISSYESIKEELNIPNGGGDTW